VFGSEVTYDATTIHPDDYRLAERLVEHAALPVPPSHPEGWVKPDYSKLAEANAAADKKLEDQQAAFGAMPEAEAHEDASLVADAEVSDNSADESFGETVAEESSVSVATDSVASEVVESDASGVETEATGDATDVAATSENADTTSDGSLPASAGEVVSHMPPIATEPLQQTPLSIDAERLARSWQVGREKLRRVAHALQFPFADERDFRYPVPLISKMPRLDSLKPGDMLQALVLSVTDFGVFVELGPECNGLIHISRLSNRFLEDPHQYVQAGDLMNVWVVNIDEKKKRVALSAIPPGSQAAREPREEREGDSRRSGRPAGRGAPARAEQGTGAGNNRPAGTGSRESGDRNDRSGGGNRGSFGGRNDRSRNDRNDRGRPGRGRNEHSGDDRRDNRRPARVEPPKPVVPITEAMQQGKEPLRSFSDLMQFMKKPKAETEIVPESNPAPVAESKEAVEPKEMAPQNSDDTQSGPVA
jgi:predicted RNA-binding protein with RPS1 domain